MHLAKRKWGEEEEEEGAINQAFFEIYITLYICVCEDGERESRLASSKSLQ